MIKEDFFVVVLNVLFESYGWNVLVHSLMQIVGFLKLYVFRNSLTVERLNVGLKKNPTKTDQIIKWQTCSSNLLLKVCKSIQPIVDKNGIINRREFLNGHSIFLLDKLFNLKSFFLNCDQNKSFVYFVFICKKNFQTFVY